MIFNYDQQRKLYMQQKISHEEFYLSFAEAIAFDDLKVLVPESACKLKEPCLNDVSLRVWDYRFPAVRLLLSRAIDQGSVIKRSNGLPAAESVCLLKTVAKDYITNLQYI